MLRKVITGRPRAGVGELEEVDVVTYLDLSENQGEHPSTTWPTTRL